MSIRGFRGSAESTNLSRDHLSMEIGRSGGVGAPQRMLGAASEATDKGPGKAEYKR